GGRVGGRGRGTPWEQLHRRSRRRRWGSCSPPELQRLSAALTPSGVLLRRPQLSSPHPGRVVAPTTPHVPANQPRLQAAALWTGCCGPVCFGTPASSSRTVTRFAHVRPVPIQRPILRPPRGQDRRH